MCFKPPLPKQALLQSISHCACCCACRILPKDAQLEMSATKAAGQLLVEEEPRQAEAAAKKARKQKQKARKAAGVPAAEADKSPRSLRSRGSSAPAATSGTSTNVSAGRSFVPFAAPEPDESLEMICVSASAPEPAQSADVVSDSSPRHAAHISQLAASTRRSKDAPSWDRFAEKGLLDFSSREGGVSGTLSKRLRRPPQNKDVPVPQSLVLGKSYAREALLSSAHWPIGPL